MLYVCGWNGPSTYTRLLYLSLYCTEPSRNQTRPDQRRQTDIYLIPHECQIPSSTTTHGKEPKKKI